MTLDDTEITSRHPAMKRNHISAAHTDDDVARRLEAAERVLNEIARS